MIVNFKYINNYFYSYKLPDNIKISNNNRIIAARFSTHISRTCGGAEKSSFSAQIPNLRPNNPIIRYRKSGQGG